MNTHDKIVKCRSCGYVGPCDPTCCEHPDYDGATAEEAWQAAIEVHRKRIAALEAARIAYASEFPPNKDGEPDVGSIHENIRKLKADLQRKGEPVAYRLLRKNADGEWVTDGRPWCDGVPDADLVKDSEKSGQYRIEYAFAAPQPAEPVKRKRRYAQGTALGEFGIIPICAIRWMTSR